jgi:hypothetical protein
LVSDRQALYELALLKIHLWHQHYVGHAESKKQVLAEARATLKRFVRSRTVFREKSRAAGKRIYNQM